MSTAVAESPADLKERNKALIAEVLEAYPDKSAKRRAKHLNTYDAEKAECSVKSNIKSIPGVMTIRGCAYAGSKGVVWGPIKDMVHISHGPVGCGQYSWAARRNYYIGMTGVDSFVTMQFTSDFQERDIVFGGDKKLEKIIDEIILGMDETYQDDCVARWEHIRRYMEEDGPPLPAGERLALTRGFSHRLAFARGGLWVLIPGFYDDFRKEPIGIILGTLAQLITLPAMLMFAFFRWLAEVTSNAPWWPEAVLRDAGGAPLPEDQVHAEADALKRAQEKIQEAALDEEERHERDMIKAKAGKPFWTTERRKFAIAIAAVIAVVAIGKGVQAWLSGT